MADDLLCPFFEEDGEPRVGRGVGQLFGRLVHLGGLQFAFGFGQFGFGFREGFPGFVQAVLGEVIRQVLGEVFCRLELFVCPVFGGGGFEAGNVWLQVGIFQRVIQEMGGDEAPDEEERAGGPFPDSSAPGGAGRFPFAPSD